MKLSKILSLLLMLAVLPGVALAKEMSAEKVAKKIKVGNTDDETILDFRAPDINSLTKDPVYIRSFFDKLTGVVVHFVIVEYDFLKDRGTGDSTLSRSTDSVYKNFDRTVDEDGNEFETEVFHQDFDGCGSNTFCQFEEYFRITLRDEYVRAHSESGLTLFAKAKSGRNYKIEIYPAYVQGVLSRLQEEREKLGLD